MDDDIPFIIEDSSKKRQAVPPAEPSALLRRVGGKPHEPYLEPVENLPGKVKYPYLWLALLAFVALSGWWKLTYLGDNKTEQERAQIIRDKLEEKFRKDQEMLKEEYKQQRKWEQEMYLQQQKKEAERKLMEGQ